MFPFGNVVGKNKKTAVPIRDADFYQPERAVLFSVLGFIQAITALFDLLQIGLHFARLLLNGHIAHGHAQQLRPGIP